jgi:hypothetical protein
MGMFSKATEKAKVVVESTTANKKNTTWTAGDPEGDQVGKAVHKLVELSTQVKALEGQMAMHETVVKDFALRQFVGHIAEVGVLPETPNYVQNSMGEKVTFVTADRSTMYKVKPEQKEALTALLGEESVAELTYTEVAFKFNRDVMAKPGVAEAVEKALEAVYKKLVTAGKLTEEDVLVDADVKEAFKPGTLGRVGIICGKDTTKIRGFLDAMNSSFTKYIKC